MQPLIITAAVTGGGNVPSMNPKLPLTPEQIAADALAAAAAGAAIVHLHARDPQSGFPSSDAAHFAPALQAIHAGCDAVISMTTPGRPDMPVAERLAAVERFRPEMAAIVMGTTNYSFYDRIPAVDRWTRDWEASFLEASRDFVYKNTFADLEYIFRLLGRLAVRAELEVFGPAQLYNLAHLVDRGLVAPPLHVEFVMGLLGGVRGEAEDLVFLVNKAHKLFGHDGVTWSLSGMVGFGRFDLMPLAIQMGGHIRVGMEDNVEMPNGGAAASNAAIVAHYVDLAAALGRTVASPREVRDRLRLKGRDTVAFAHP